MEKFIVTVSRHTFLDCSVGWFVRINGVKTGGEIINEEEAIEEAKTIANTLGAEYDEEIHYTNEMFM